MPSNGFMMSFDGIFVMLYMDKKGKKLGEGGYRLLITNDQLKENHENILASGGYIYGIAGGNSMSIMWTKKEMQLG